jgi:hypothetical protein
MRSQKHVARACRLCSLSEPTANLTHLEAVPHSSSVFLPLRAHTPELAWSGFARTPRSATCSAARTTKQVPKAARVPVNPLRQAGAPHIPAGTPKAGPFRFKDSRENRLNTLRRNMGPSKGCDAKVQSVRLSVCHALQKIKKVSFLKICTY